MLLCSRFVESTGTSVDWMSIYQNQNLKAKKQTKINSIRLLSWSLFTELIEKSARNINVLQNLSHLLLSMSYLLKWVLWLSRITIIANIKSWTLLKFNPNRFLKVFSKVECLKISFKPCQHVKINPNLKKLPSYWSTFKSGLTFKGWHDKKKIFSTSLAISVQ